MDSSEPRPGQHLCGADEAIRILTKEYGADYARAIGTKSKRENIARDPEPTRRGKSTAGNPFHRSAVVVAPSPIVAVNRAREPSFFLAHRGK
jgi:hypothetical protein